MKNKSRFFALAALSFATLAMMPSAASAQWGIFGGNGSYNRNSSYVRNSRAMVVTLNNHSREFARRLDRELDRSRYNGRWNEDRLNAMAREFYQAADDLEDNWGNGRYGNRNDNDLRRVLMLGGSLDRELSRARLSWSLQSDWSRIREDLDRLRYSASNFGGYDDNNGWGRGNNGNGNWNRGNNSDQNRKNRFPFPF